MPHIIFVSHVEEDSTIAIELAQELERAGFTTWYYERDCLPGPDYLLQVPVAIDQSRIVAVVISPHSLGSNQVTSEIVKAYEARKSFVPLLLGITHAEFQQRQPVWRQALGASTSLALPSTGIASVIPRIIAGVRVLLAAPADTSTTGAVPTQVQRTESAAERFTRFFAERPDIIAEVEAEATRAPQQTAAECNRLLVRLEIIVWPRVWKGSENLAHVEELLRLIDQHDANLDEARDFISTSRQSGVSMDDFYGALKRYQRAIGDSTKIRRAMVALGETVVPLVCLAFRRVYTSDAHNCESDGYLHTWRLELELAEVLSQLKDIRALPFFADAMLTHQVDMNGRNSWGLGIVRAVQAFRVDRNTVDQCFQRLVGVTGTEILRESREKNAH